MPGSTFNKVEKIRYRINRFRRDISWRLGLRNDYLQRPEGARILVYHGICREDHLRFNTLFITVKNFEEQLRLYKKYFRILSLDDFYQQRFDSTQFNVCLSFDDGFANNYKYVLPLLEQYEVPAAFFITGARDAGYDSLWNDVLSIAYKCGPSQLIFKKEKFVKGAGGKYISALTGRYWVDILREADFETKREMMDMFGNLKQLVDEDYWLQMTSEQIRQLAASKWTTIGCHGYYHNDLARMPADRVRKELLQARNYLEAITQRKIDALAFPYGSYTQETIALAKEMGFTRLLATQFLHPQDGDGIVLRERFTINPFISNINQMHANITGHYK